MVRLSDNIKAALKACIERGIPFFLYRRPGSEECIFYSSPDGVAESGKTVFHAAIKPWKESAPEIPFCGVFDAEKTLEYLSSTREDIPADYRANAMEPCRISTNQDEYEASLSALIPELKREKRKTVVSTVICGKSYGVQWVAVAESLFNAFPQTMGFFYYTHETGFWLGASPEVLLRHNTRAGVLETMALAGTRPLDTEGDWDEKNIREHEFVREYIVDAMKACGLSPECAPMCGLKYGTIEHLHTAIKARCEGTDSDKVYLKTLSALHPTPALCGFPKLQAIKDIESVEAHPRYCYGGYIRIEQDGGAHEAYVNLRCVHFDKTGWCAYAGGGIMGDSEPCSEWQETRRKASTLIEIINRNTLFE